MNTQEKIKANRKSPYITVRRIIDLIICSAFVACGSYMEGILNLIGL